MGNEPSRMHVLRQATVVLAVSGCLVAVEGGVAPAAAAGPEIEYGTGVVSVNGHGAEHWHWEYRKA